MIEAVLSRLGLSTPVLSLGAALAVAVAGFGVIEWSRRRKRHRITELRAEKAALQARGDSAEVHLHRAREIEGEIARLKGGGS